eukprot:Amastigsp_a127_372.p1 type:complete len:301 gc:universal Amastigsp_a127_372:907-5(-)
MRRGRSLVASRLSWTSLRIAQSRADSGAESKRALEHIGREQRAAHEPRADSRRRLYAPAARRRRDRWEPHGLARRMVVPQHIADLGLERVDVVLTPKGHEQRRRVARERNRKPRGVGDPAALHPKRHTNVAERVGLAAARAAAARVHNSHGPELPVEMNHAHHGEHGHPLANKERKEKPRRGNCRNNRRFVLVRVRLGNANKDARAKDHKLDAKNNAARHGRSRADAHRFGLKKRLVEDTRDSGRRGRRKHRRIHNRPVAFEPSSRRKRNLVLVVLRSGDLGVGRSGHVQRREVPPCTLS